MMNKVYIGDNLDVLRELSTESIDLIYIDPPFNTGKSQKRTRIKVVQSSEGDRKGFLGKTYTTIPLGTQAYNDDFGSSDQYLEFLEPRLRQAHRILANHGTLYFHIDYREVHYCKILLDKIFGRSGFMNEIIWAYDYGGRSKTRWPAKHDNILVYAKDPKKCYFNVKEMKKMSYRAPDGSKKGTANISPSDVWWHTIVPTNSKRRTGYPTQKPTGILNKIIETSSKPGSLVLDFFAGSGTTGESCLALGRNFILVDSNPEAEKVMHKRFADHSVIFIETPSKLESTIESIG